MKQTSKKHRIPPYMKENYNFLYSGNSFHRRIIEHLNAIATCKDIIREIEDAKDDALIYDYRAGADGGTWKEKSRVDIPFLFGILKDVTKIARSLKWENERVVDTPPLRRAFINLPPLLNELRGKRNLIREAFGVAAVFKYTKPEFRLNFESIMGTSRVADVFDSFLISVESMADRENILRKRKDALQSLKNVAVGLTPGLYSITRQDGTLDLINLQIYDSAKLQLIGSDAKGENKKVVTLSEIKELYRIPHIASPKISAAS